MRAHIHTYHKVIKQPSYDKGITGILLVQFLSLIITRAPYVLSGVLSALHAQSQLSLTINTLMKHDYP